MQLIHSRTDLPARPHGCRRFPERFLRPYLRPGLTVYEIGEEAPCIAPELKRALGLRIIALDARRRLHWAPLGLYDAIICADLLDYRGPGDGDLAICQGVFEREKDSGAVFATIAGLLKPGGVLLLHARSQVRHAPRLFRRHAAAHGLVLIDEERYLMRGSVWLRALVRVGTRVWRLLTGARTDRGFFMALEKGVGEPITERAAPRAGSERNAGQNQAVAKWTPRFHWPTLSGRGNPECPSVRSHRAGPARGMPPHSGDTAVAQ